MANELVIAGVATGSAVDVDIRNMIGEIYTSVGPAFETQVGANIANYARALAENGTTGVFMGDFPAVAAGRYGVTYRLRSGGSPAWTDDAIGFEAIDWSGTAVIGPATDSAGVTTLLSRVPSVVPTAAQIWDYVPESTAPTPNALRAGAMLVLAAAGEGLNAAAIADAVWDEASAGHVSAGSTGAALLDKAGHKLASDGLDLVVIETGVNARQALSPILAASCGVLLGAATETVVLKGGAVSTTRITATTDADGNRTAVVLNLPT